MFLSFSVYVYVREREYVNKWGWMYRKGPFVSKSCTRELSNIKYVAGVSNCEEISSLTIEVYWSPCLRELFYGQEM